MKHAKKFLEEVQSDLMKFIFAETILIGHGIGNDLKALKVIKILNSGRKEYILAIYFLKYALGFG